MSRPKILLIPTICGELEWRIHESIEEWADVATFDAPGVGDTPAVEGPAPEVMQNHGLAQIKEREWDRCVVVGDEYGIYHAVHIAAAVGPSLQGLALGHACLSLRQSGDRAPVSGEVWGAMTQLRDADYRTFVRHLTQLTQGAYDDEMTDEYLERITPEINRRYEIGPPHAEKDLEPLIASLEAPLLFARHEGCLLFTDEGWKDAVAAFPEASTITTQEKPSASPRFAEALREFCEGLES